MRRRGHGAATSLSRLAGLVGLLATTAVLAGCGSASVASPPTGVDGLVIPTPSADPRDFVSGIDNRWLPYRPGARWTYDLIAQDIAGGTGTMTVTVQPGTTSVAGVRTTAVRTVVATATTSKAQVDYYAQDDAGNVWWFGEQAQRNNWQAGTDGAQAGLAMPANPRYGDGWREAYAAGVVEDRAEVVDVDDAFAVPGTRYTHVLDLAASSDLAPGISRVRSYAAGVGLVRSYAQDGPAELVELTSGP